jgi:hypothetical protein
MDRSGLERHRKKKSFWANFYIILISTPMYFSNCLFTDRFRLNFCIYISHNGDTWRPASAAYQEHSTNYENPNCTVIPRTLLPPSS